MSSVVWNLVPTYSAMVEDLKADRFGTHPYKISLADDSIQLLQTKHIPDAVWTQIMDLRKDLIDGKIKSRADLRCAKGARADDVGRREK